MEIFVSTNKKDRKGVVAFYEELEDNAGVANEIATRLLENDYKVKLMIEKKLPAEFVIDVVDPDYKILAKEAGHVEIEFDIFKL
jgi:hypothetical protein